MKRFVSILLTAMLLVSLIPAGAVEFRVAAFAEKTSGDYTYTVTDGEATITAVDAKITVANIPLFLDGCLVTGIGERAFSNCDKLTSIFIPGHIKTIGMLAFRSCRLLESAVFAEGVTTIGMYTFQNCKALRSVTIPASVARVGIGAFLGCSALESVCLPEGLTGIGEDAFSACASLRSVSLPDSVTAIGPGAFHDCYALEEVTLPCGMTTISEGTFEGCSSLSSVTIPDGMTSIGKSAFEYCSSLSSVTIPDSVTDIGDWAFGYCTSLRSITVPDGVRTIGGRAFFSCTALTQVTLPSTVAVVGDGAFNRCNALSDVYISDLAAWCNVDFGDTAGLQGATLHWNGAPITELVIPEGVTHIHARAFEANALLTSVSFPQSLVSIGDGAFSDCRSLTTLTIPNTVEDIGDSAFAGCSGLVSVSLPSHLNTLGSYAFEGCTELTAVAIPDGVTAINPFTFNACKALSSITLPDGLKTIGRHAFSQCSLLTALDIPDSVTQIQGSAFSHCTALATIAIPKGVTKIGDYAFQGCRLLQKITIPNGVTAIGDLAFNGCQALKAITLPNSVTSIGENAFAYCPALAKVTFGNNVTTIGGGAFQGCTALRSVTLPETLTSLGSLAYEGCTALKTIVIPNGITKIENNTFSGCNNLAEITIPISVKTVNPMSFKGCYALRTVYYGGNKLDREKIYIDSMGNATLKQAKWVYTCAHTQTGVKGSVEPTCIKEGYTGDVVCTGCDIITATGEKIPAKGHVFGEDAVCVGCGVAPFTYTVADGAATISSASVTLRGHVVIPTVIQGVPVTTVANNAFKDCVNITAVTIPESITKLGYSVFKNCSALATVYYNAENCATAGVPAYPVFDGCTAFTTLYIGKNVTYVPKNLFRQESGATEPTALTTVYLTKNIQMVDTNAFHMCTNIEAVNFVGTAGEFADFVTRVKGYNSALTGASSVNYGTPCFDGHVWAAECDTECDLCGEEHEGAHNEIVEDAATAPTCTTAGLTAGSHCAACGSVIVKQTAVPALGHLWDTGKVLIAPTESANGSKLYTCITCGETKTVVLMLSEIRDGYYYYNGVLTKNAGLVQVEDNYYYVTSTGAVRTGRFALAGSEEFGIEKGTYYFFPDGRLNLARGVYDNRYYNDQGKSEAYVGMVEWKGAKYCVNDGGKVVVGRYFVSKLNGLLLKKRAYTFFDDGRLLEDTRIHTDGYYYEDGIRIPYAGIVEYEGHFYLVTDSGKYETGRRVLTTRLNNSGKAKGYYYYDENGHMLFNVVRENRYYGADGLATYAAGVVAVDGKCYFNHGTHGALRTDYTVTVTEKNANGLLVPGKYHADANGVLTPAA